MRLLTFFTYDTYNFVDQFEIKMAISDFNGPEWFVLDDVI